MARRRYNLPPLTTLATFEAAARHLSFKHAAEELNVTPGAVSHQIKLLEKDLGLKLFEREHRAVSFTEAGERLFMTLERGFSDISATLARLRQNANDGAVTIAATTAVSSLWLTSRLARFWKEHGAIPVNQLVTDFPVRPDDLVDLKITYGRAPTEGEVRTKLFNDYLVPVVSPAFKEAHPEPSLSDLAQMPIIHMMGDESRWTSWRTWFETLGYGGDIKSTLRVNNYTIALQAAQDDAGVVLGWKRLVTPLLDRGVLVTFSEFGMEAPHAFHIVSNSPEQLSKNARILREWLLENV